MDLKTTDCFLEFSSIDEWKAHQISLVIKKYYREIYREITNIPNDFLDKLNFEIINRKDIIMCKRNLIIIGNTYKPVDLDSIHLHLNTLGINKKFVDKSTPFDGVNLDTKRYLVVFPK